MFYATVREVVPSLPRYSNSPTSTLMKNASKLFLIAFGSVLLSLPAALRADDPAPAGGPPPPPPEHHERRKEMGERMAKELGLTADQQTKMKAIMEEQRTAGEAIRADTSLSREQKREKMAQLWQDSKAKRMAILTPDQQKKAEEFFANHPEGGGPRHKKDKGEGAPAAPAAPDAK